MFALDIICALGQLATRFWEKVDKNGPIMRPELSQCWQWTGYKSPAGYGRLFIFTRGKRNNDVRIATQVSYALHTGTWPSNFVLHKCDNPRCVNPDHLYLGSQKQNAVDRCTRGRSNTVHGARNGKTKISEATALELIRLRAEGMPFKQIAGKFNLSINTVHGIVYGKRWKFLPRSAA